MTTAYKRENSSIQSDTNKEKILKDIELVKTIIKQ